MSRTESSVSASIAQLVAQDEERRREQVLLAHRRKQQQERQVIEEQTRLAQEARVRAEQAARNLQEQTLRQHLEQRRLEQEDLWLIERTRIETEQAARVALMRLEHQKELERLTLIRDERVRSLEGQRGFLVASLVTTLVGAISLYGLLIRPAEQRQQASLLQQASASQSERAQWEEQRASWRKSAENLEQSLRDKDTEIAKLRQTLAQAAQATRPLGPRATNAPPVRPVPKPKCTCPANDPLCDCW